MPRATVTAWDTLPLLLSVPQVMEVLGLSKGVAYDLMHRDGFPAIWVNDRIVRVSRDCLRQWVEEQAGANGKDA